MGMVDHNVRVLWFAQERIKNVHQYRNYILRTYHPAYYDSPSRQDDFVGRLGPSMRPKLWRTSDVLRPGTPQVIALCFVALIGLTSQYIGHGAKPY